MKLKELNNLPRDKAEQELLHCCGSRAWAAQMAENRPFENKVDLEGVADTIWGKLTQEDYHEAFAAHPRIGTTKKVSAWAEGEQAGMQSAESTLKQQMAKLNDEYFERFGFVFLICATGKSAEEMFEAIKQRIQNDATKEFEIAKIEQSKITKIRLEKLLCQD